MKECQFSIREAIPNDEMAILGFIQELADYEQEPDAVEVSAQELAKDLFEDKVCSAILLIDNNLQKAVGMAIYYVSYSTWKGKCLYLEDFYIQPNYRRKGGGALLFSHLLGIVKDRGYRRMDWQVLEWNEPAIKFYQKIGAELDNGWINGRLHFQKK